MLIDIVVQYSILLCSLKALNGFLSLFLLRCVLRFGHYVIRSHFDLHLLKKYGCDVSMKGTVVSYKIYI